MTKTQGHLGTQCRIKESANGVEVTLTKTSKTIYLSLFKAQLFLLSVFFAFLAGSVFAQRPILTPGFLFLLGSLICLTLMRLASQKKTTVTYIQGFGLLVQKENNHKFTCSKFYAESNLDQPIIYEVRLSHSCDFPRKQTEAK